MEEMTVKKLLEECEKQIKKGNGDKVVVVTDDDEVNGYHTLYFGFCDDAEELHEIADADMLHDSNNPDEIVALG